MKTRTKNWCGEGDLNSRTTLKTRKLYTARSSQNTRSARSTPPSHTTSHTALKRPGKWVAWSPCCALSKEDAKKRGRSSPDLAEALVMALARIVPRQEIVAGTLLIPSTHI
jgi:hypothetical protein